MPDISKADFKVKLEALCDRLGIEIKPSVVPSYYAILNSQLSPDLFERAWQHLYASYDGYRLPSPQQFIEAAVGTVEQRAIAEWDVLTKLSDKRQPCTVTATAAQALRHIGGTMALRGAAPKDRSFLRRDFMQFYTSKVDLGEFDGSPVELGQYNPVDFPGQLGGANLRALPGPIEVVNQKRLAAMVARIGGNQRSRDLPPVQILQGPTPREQFEALRATFDPANLHSDRILRDEQVQQLAGQLRAIAVGDEQLGAEVETFLQQALTPVITAA
jgi:hypothetical protein